MKDVQDFETYSEAYDYAQFMDFENGFIILPFAEGYTVFVK